MELERILIRLLRRTLGVLLSLCSELLGLLEGDPHSCLFISWYESLGLISLALELP